MPCRGCWPCWMPRTCPVTAESQGGRLFFALWPDGVLRRQLEIQVRRLPRRLGRPVPLENLHITLLFLGQVPATRLGCVLAAPEEVAAASFELTLDYVGHWPRPRVLWVGPRHTPPALFRLVGALRRALAPCGLDLDRRPYQAHMTVLRKVARAPERQVEIEPVTWQVSSYSLMESIPGEGGVAYRELRRWPLTGDG